MKINPKNIWGGGYALTWSKMVKLGPRGGAYRPRLPLSGNPETKITCACMLADFLWRKVTKLT